MFAATDLADFTFHVEICEDFWSATPPSTHGRARRRAASCATCRRRTSWSARRTIASCSARRSRCAARPRTSIRPRVRARAPPTSRGTGRRRSTSSATGSPRAPASRRTARCASPTSTSSGCDSSACAPARSTTRPSRPTIRSDASGASASSIEPTFDDVGLERCIDRFPFVPDDPAKLDRDCYEAFNIQVHGLVQRLQATGTKRVVIGISGGLDSTHALIVAAKAFDALGFDRARTSSASRCRASRRRAARSPTPGR